MCCSSRQLVNFVTLQVPYGGEGAGGQIGQAETIIGWWINCLFYKAGIDILHKVHVQL